MNERIKELAEQAELAANKGDQVDVKIMMTKFAELIIKECADKAYKTAWDDLTHGYGHAVIPLHLYNSIKEHFGVTE